MSIAEMDSWTGGLVDLIALPGGALCLMALIVCKRKGRYFGLLFGCFLLAAVGSSIISISLSQTFVPPSFLASFYSQGVWTVNPRYRPALPQLLCAIAVVAGAFGLAFHQVRQGRRRVGGAFLIIACSALSGVAVWVWTVGSLYGYRTLVGG
jgi:hypothetical protein